MCALLCFCKCYKCAELHLAGSCCNFMLTQGDMMNFRIFDPPEILKSRASRSTRGSRLPIYLGVTSQTFNIITSSPRFGKRPACVCTNFNNNRRTLFLEEYLCIHNTEPYFLMPGLHLQPSKSNRSSPIICPLRQDRKSHSHFNPSYLKQH